jgi:polysaccharide deacetylase family protein (PEP-CTERM system associated)
LTDRGRAATYLTVDVEEWFHAPDHRLGRDAALWDGLRATLPEVLPKTLELMDRLGAKATFFVLGWVAQRHPDLVRSIVSAGHELACHGWNHQRVDRMAKDSFFEDVHRAKALLEDIGGQRVVGFRAPCWSFGKEVWPYEILAGEGFLYSSSRLPIPGLGVSAPADRTPAGVTEIPALTGTLAGLTLPAGGTVALRIMPLAWLRSARDRRVAKGAPAVYWFHPWELADGGPKLDGGAFFRWARYSRLDSLPARLADLVPSGDRRLSLLLGSE